MNILFIISLLNIVIFHIFFCNRSIRIVFHRMWA